MPSAGGAREHAAQGAQGTAAPPGLVPGLRWRRVFPGHERQLGELRRWLASLLPAGPARDDAVIVACELAGNAIRHTASGQDGWFAAEVTWHATIADGGGPSQPYVIDDPGAEHGRGLQLVRGLSVRSGWCGDERGRLVWAHVAWQRPDGEAQPVAQDWYEAAIRDGEAALASNFAGVRAWFGRATLQWWALCPSGLVTAASAEELAGLLRRPRR
jgi:hypothetical protein